MDSSAKHVQLSVFAIVPAGVTEPNRKHSDARSKAGVNIFTKTLTGYSCKLCSDDQTVKQSTGRSLKSTAQQSTA